MVLLLRPARRVYSKNPTCPALTARANSGKLADWHRARVTPARFGTQQVSRGEREMGHPCRFGKTGPGIAASLAALVWLGASGASPALAASDRGTFSIVAYDSVTQELGVAVQSKYFSVGTDVPWAEAGVGAVATQARLDPSFGCKALGLFRGWPRAADVLRALVATDCVLGSLQRRIAVARRGLADRSSRNVAR